MDQFEVCIVEDNGFDWDYIPQGRFDNREEAVKLHQELCKKGFEYVCIRKAKAALEEYEK